MRKIILRTLFLVAINSISAQVITYPQTEGISQSINYSVLANGQQVGVYDSPIVSYAAFDMQGKVTIKIKANRDVKWVEIRPRNLNITPTWSADSTIQFSIDKPCNLSIELNGAPLEFPLFLFANPLETNVPSANDPNVIYFEAGKVHKAGLIVPKSNQTVYIGPGAVVDGFIFAENAENIKVCGRGVLLGTNNKQSSDWNKHKFVHFKSCKNITINDIMLVDAFTWQVVPENCDNVNINGIRLLAGNPSDDGIDVVRSRNVIIKNCFIRVKDDCVAIKGHLNYPDNVNTSNIKVSDCTFWNAEWGNGIEIGFELQCDEVKDIVFKNCDIIHVDKGAAISIHNGDDAKVSNVLFEDIRIEDCNQKLFDLAIFYTQYSVDKPKTQAEIDKRYLHGAWDGVLYLNPEERKAQAKYRGAIESITFKNISVTDGIFPYSLFSGYDENHKVKNITVQNLTIHGKKIKKLKDLRLYSEFSEGIKIK